MKFKSKVSRFVGGLLLIASTCTFTPSDAQSVTKSGARVLPVVISKARPTSLILPTDAILSEVTASEELQRYLTAMTGAKVEVVREDVAIKPTGTRIYLGPTKFAGQYLGEKGTLSGEEWMLQNVNGDLIITGGRTRGTLYGVYHFLEDICGVRWWSRWEETVPRHSEIRINALQRREKPAFSYRDIYRQYHGGDDWDNGRAAARARLNRDGDNPISALYGGANTYGPPEHTHTAAMYISKDKYFAEHPDWFALVNGQRVAGHTEQLDYTNPEMRAEFLRLLLENIRKSRAAATSSLLPLPTIYAVDQNDGTSWCSCERCSALVAREGSQAGPMVDFVNYMADGIRQEFPDVLLSTLAYQASESPPKTLHPRENVVVKLTDTTNSYTVPVTAPANQQMRNLIESWAAIAPRLQIWDYSTFYPVNGQNVGFPFPSEHIYATDYRFYQKNRVNRVFVEFENTVTGDARDLKLWLMAKLLENPNADDKKLINEFTDGFYGPAGTYIRDYRQQLLDAAQRNKANLRFFGSVSAFSYAKLSDILKMQVTFDRAEKAVAGNTVLLRRVRHMRLSLDRLTLFFYPAYLLQHKAAGGKMTTLPFKREVIGQRALQTWIEQAKMRLPASKQQEEIDMATQEIKRYLEIPKEFPIPAKFGEFKREQIIDLPAAALAFANNSAMKSSLIDDPEAPTGKTEVLNFDNQADRELYSLPMQWGFYDLSIKKDTKLPPLKKEDIIGPGYHWYKMGTVVNLDTFFAYFTWSWNIQCSDNNDAIARSGRNGRYDVWANMKFEGPMHGFDIPGQKNALFVERVILTPAKP